jgi:hypothetical protein
MFVRPLDAMHQVIIIVCLVIALLALGWFTERKLMRHYWQRACTGRHWRRRFPDASKAEIREFLDVFLEAFGFTDRRRLCFEPDDRVMDVYRSLYPVRGGADSMELEGLVASLQKRYQADFLGSWREDITLGDLFRQTRAVA